MHPRQLMQVQTLRVPQMWRGPQSHALYGGIQPEEEVANNPIEWIQGT